MSNALRFASKAAIRSCAAASASVETAALAATSCAADSAAASAMRRPSVSACAADKALLRAACTSNKKVWRLVHHHRWHVGMSSWFHDRIMRVLDFLHDSRAAVIATDMFC